MRIFSSIILLLALIASTAFAQKQAWWSKPALHAAHKIASHEDTPLTCWEFAWNDTSSHWDSIAIVANTYNPDGTLAVSERSDDNGTNLVLFQRNAYAYYPDGKLKDMWYLYRNGNAWDSTAHDYYTYDQFGNTLMYRSDIYNGTNWDHASGELRAYTYRNVDQIETSMGSQWSMNGQAWIPVDSILYTYDGNNERTSDIHWGYNVSVWEPSFQWIGYSWHSFADLAPSAATKQVYNNGWVDAERFTATYGPYNSPTAIFEQSMAPGQWDTAYQVVQEFDAHDHQLLSENYLYQSGAFVLYSGQQDTFFYDGLGRTLERLVYFSDGIQYYRTSRYLYDAFFVGTDESAATRMKVATYPNPVADRLHFQMHGTQRGPVVVRLYDLQGRMRYESRIGQAASEFTLPISDALENGTYLYRVTTQAGQATGKVVVQR